MTREEARCIAVKLNESLPDSYHRRLKAIHVVPRLHQGFLTVRAHFTNSTAPDPEPYIFTAEELI